MKTPTLAIISRLLLPVLLAIGLVQSTSAQDGAGTIAGRVFNPASGEYMRNAMVQLDGTNRVAFTTSDGEFSFVDVPAGEATVTVQFSGYRDATEDFVVTPGQVVRHEIQMIRIGARGAVPEGEVVVLSPFTVTAERTGNAKAIMDQKRNMNVSNTVSADFYGNVTDGNVGEFLKYMPGVDIEYSKSEARGPRIGGLDPEYVGVTIDGIKLASADALNPGKESRGTSFQSFSITAIESIEVNMTTSPEMDADAPAGTVALRTKRAFDRKGRHFGYNLGLTLNSKAFTLGSDYGPDDRKHPKARPNYSFEYSDTFFNKRLGIVAAVSHSDSYLETHRFFSEWNRTTIPGVDERPDVIWRMSFADMPTSITKDTGSLVTDFHATDKLSFSLTSIYNRSIVETQDHSFNFAVAQDNTGASGRQVSSPGYDGVTTVSTTPGKPRNMVFAGASSRKITETVTIAPSFEYKSGRWTIDGQLNYSKSRNPFQALDAGFARTGEDLSSFSLVSGNFIATRPDVDSAQWRIQQLDGPPWSDLSSFKFASISDEGHTASTEIDSGALNAKVELPFDAMPTFIKFGVKRTEEIREYQDASNFKQWRYAGPTGNIPAGQSSWAGYESPAPFVASIGEYLSVYDPSGQQVNIPRADRNAIADLFQEHPEYFTAVNSVNAYYNANFGSLVDIKQGVTAGYAMADITVSSKLKLLSGLRWEETQSDAHEFDPHSRQEILAAGFGVGGNGLSTSIDGLNYQYLDKPGITRTKKYDDFFPMIAVKYEILPNLQAHVGFNEAILRPRLDYLTGAWVILDEPTGSQTQPRLNAKNPDLLPEYSKNYVARLAYYFEPAGQLTLTVRQNDITNQLTTVVLSKTGTPSRNPVDYGFDPAFEDYAVNTPINETDPLRFRSLDIGYTQTLTFLPRAFQGTTVNLSYTHATTSRRNIRTTPNRVAGFLGFRYKDFYIRPSAWWQSNTPSDSVVGRYKQANWQMDLNAGYRFTERLELYVQGRNITNRPVVWYENPEGVDSGGYLAQSENYGANWVFGIKGSF